MQWIFKDTTEYNLTFLNFDDKWRAWVKKTYPSK